MKKTVSFFILAVIAVLSVMTGCQKSSSDIPEATPVPTPAGGSSALISVPGGTFAQTDGASSFSHTVSAFKIGKYEVTYDLWYAVYQWAVAHGYAFKNTGGEGNSFTYGAAPGAARYQPVTLINWRDMIVWCNAYSEKSGLNACYTYTSAVIKDSNDANAAACDNAVCAWANNGYRLPSEGEWQYVASYNGGSSWTPYNYASGATADYTDASATGLVAWYSVNSGGATHTVGGKNANGLGICDMAGNVMEWCWDWDGTYPGTSTDYRGPASGSYRVIRGGSFYYDASHLPVGYRDYVSTNGILGSIGFRIARTY